MAIPTVGMEATEMIEIVFCGQSESNHYYDDSGMTLADAVQAYRDASFRGPIVIRSIGGMSVILERGSCRKEGVNNG